MDLVANHTSDEHFWFRIAQNEANSDERNFYIFKSPKYDQNGNMIPPNNWKSFFKSIFWDCSTRVIYNNTSTCCYYALFNNPLNL